MQGDFFVEKKGIVFAMRQVELKTKTDLGNEEKLNIVIFFVVVAILCVSADGIAYF